MTPATSTEGLAVPLKVINQLVTKLVELHRTSSLELTFQIGQLVVQDLFDGDLELLHQTGPKSVALRQLANHERLPFSPSILSRSIGAYQIMVRSPEFRTAEGLHPSHFHVVLSLPPAQQDRLLRKAVDKRWSTEQLAKEAAVHRTKELAEGAARPGRPALPAGFKTASHLGRLLERDAQTLDTSFVEELNEDQVARLKQVLEELQTWCLAVETAVATRVETVVEGHGQEADE